MAPTTDSPAVAMRRLINGYQVTQALCVAATLGLADMLDSGPRTSDDLAAETGAHAETLYRLMRALATVDIVREEPGRNFRLTDFGAVLRTDHPHSARGWAMFVGEPSYWQAWGDLLHSVQTGENAFRHIHGTDPWSYRAQHPHVSELFDRVMASNSSTLAEQITNVVDFGRFATIVDVGGGNGALLAAILANHRDQRGIVFDQPHVVSGATSVLAAAGVEDRCAIVDGSFFDAVPAGGDAYLLKAIIHDWEDEDCLRILRVCRQAMDVGNALLIIERELGEPNERQEAKFADLNMLVSPGGRERTTAEYAGLVEAAGFRFVGVTPTAAGLAVFESTAI